ncbi:MAG: hypothetical protein AB1Z23_09445 [Eubacteriales bacterium]
MYKKIIFLFVIAIVITSFSSMSFADNTINEDLLSIDGLEYTYISTTVTNLEITAGGLAECYASISCYSGTDSVRISAYLERYSGGTWTTLQHWSENTTGNYGYMYKEYYVTSGYQYRWRVYYYAYEGDDSESTSAIDYYTY